MKVLNELYTVRYKQSLVERNFSLRRSSFCSITMFHFLFASLSTSNFKRSVGTLCPPCLSLSQYLWLFLSACCSYEALSLCFSRVLILVSCDCIPISVFEARGWLQLLFLLVENILIAFSHCVPPVCGCCVQFVVFEGAQKEPFNRLLMF